MIAREHGVPISGIRFLGDFDSSELRIAEITLESGEVQRPSWSGLRRYRPDAVADEIESRKWWFAGHRAVFCFTHASDQAGIIAIWNTKTRRWEHVIDSPFVTCALILPEIEAIVALQDVWCWGVTAHTVLSATRLGRSREGSLDTEIRTEWSESNFNPKDAPVARAAYGGYQALFLLADGKTLIACDAGRDCTLSLDDVVAALAEAPVNPESSGP